MKPVLLAALRYFALIFALGFLLGTARVMMTQPAIGLLGSLVLEVPVMVLASLVVARQTIAMYEISGLLRGLGMGGIAFLLLMVAEAALASMFYRQPPLQWAASLTRWPDVIGFGGQIAFAVIPMLMTATNKARLRL
jgi:hypothetical protein